MSTYAIGDKRPTLPEGETYWIADDANVIGDVRISDGVGIWFGATLRGDNEPIILGAQTNIQENCVLHTDAGGSPLVIGDRCTIGHKAMLHGCTIGDNTLIGMGATVLNDAVIGKNCLIGAGALVTEGKEIPDGMLVIGAPARPVRALTDTEIENLTHSALKYEKNALHFKDALRKL